MKVIKSELKDIKKRFGKQTVVGARRTNFEEVSGSTQVIDISAFVEKEPITVICSKMGWIKAQKGHKLDLSGIKYKDGDKFELSFETYTTDNILVFSSGGRVFTVLADNIAKGKGHGESLRLMLDIGGDEITTIFPYESGKKLLLASSSGKGFIIESDDLVASTKGGKQVVNVSGKDKLQVVTYVEGNMVACVGTNRKLVVFGLDEIPVMKRGQGVILQKYRDADLSDVKTFAEADGLSWNLGSKVRVENEIMSWRARRGSVGKIPPTGFPKNNKF